MVSNRNDQDFMTDFPYMPSLKNQIGGSPTEDRVEPTHAPRRAGTRPDNDPPPVDGRLHAVRPRGRAKSPHAQAHDGHPRVIRRGAARVHLLRDEPSDGGPQPQSSATTTTEQQIAALERAARLLPEDPSP